MRTISLICLSISAAAFPFPFSVAASPFPDGHDVAYEAFLNALPSAAKSAPWLTKLSGVTSPPKTLIMEGKPTVYLFACKNHFCDTDNVNIFLSPDRKSFRAVLKIGGTQALLGGAGPAEVACVRKLDAAGGALEAC